MRFAIFALLGLLVVTPATAAEAANEAHSFGSFTCAQPLPCQNASYSVGASALAANTSACVTQYTGYSAPSGFFDEIAGVDSNNCLTAKPNTIPKGMGSALSPHCCMTKFQNSCYMHCELVGQ